MVANTTIPVLLPLCLYHALLKKRFKGLHRNIKEYINMCLSLLRWFFRNTSFALIHTRWPVLINLNYNLLFLWSSENSIQEIKYVLLWVFLEWHFYNSIWLWCFVAMYESNWTKESRFSLGFKTSNSLFENEKYTS